MVLIVIENQDMGMNSEPCLVQETANSQTNRSPTTFAYFRIPENEDMLLYFQVNEFVHSSIPRNREPSAKLHAYDIFSGGLEAHGSSFPEMSSEWCKVFVGKIEQGHAKKSTDQTKIEMCVPWTRQTPLNPKALILVHLSRAGV